MKRNSAFPPGLVIYQIYPRSFNDFNQDGIGDLAGITRKLDYIAELGAGAIWLNPIYPSPMVDFGYDVADYCNVDPIFGTLDDLGQLIHEAHTRGIRIILDLVFNHTSDKHPWFVASRSAKKSPKRDWYIWADPAPDGGVPNNWQSAFGGSVWELDEGTGQYYLHSFAAAQPDLNWRNRHVRQALFDVVKFWLDRGIDGFRMDAVMWFAKDEQLRNDPPNLHPIIGAGIPYDALEHVYSRGRPEIYAYLRDLTDILKPYGNRFMLLEAQFDAWLNESSYHDFYRQIDHLIAAPFNFIDLYLPWDAERFRQFFDRFEAGLRPDDVPVYITGNHDRPRLASRIGIDGVRAAAVLFSMLPGVFVLYYGDEIGMKDGAIADAKDIYEKNMPGQGLGRDPQRTPMQWSQDRFAGFSTHKPWLAVGDNFREFNVEREASSPKSLLNLYRLLIRLRDTSTAMQSGEYIPLALTNPNLVGFVRHSQGETLAAIANFSHTDAVPCPVQGQLIVSSLVDNADAKVLAPLEGRIYRL